MGRAAAALPVSAAHNNLLARIRGVPKGPFLTLSNYVIFGLCEAGKFYCEINFFFCEWNDRLLRHKLFYLRVEFHVTGEAFLIISYRFSGGAKRAGCGTQRAGGGVEEGCDDPCQPAL